MQVALKSLKKFDNKKLNEIVDEATRLELAGIQSLSVNKKFSANLVNLISDEKIVHSIDEKVIESCRQPLCLLTRETLTKTWRGRTEHEYASC